MAVRHALVAAVIGLGLVASAACGGGGGSADRSGDTGTPKRGGTLIFARTADNTSLDPTQTGDNESIWTNEQLFETLYTVTPDGKGVRPWLATSYDRSADNTRFTFHLRKGVRFSNGAPMTADDVKFSIDRARTSGAGLTYIDGAIKRVDAPNDDTVVVTTKYPWAPLVADIALFVNGVIPKDYGGVSQDAFWKKPVGTGPFMLSSWKAGVSVDMVRNPHYWQKGKPYLDKISFTNVSDDNQRIVELKGGQAQIIRFPPFSTMDELRSSPGVVAKAFAATRVDYLLMNQNVKPYADVHVRRAISYALDRAGMVKVLLFGEGKPAASYLAETEPFFSQYPDLLSHDMARARAEMAQSSAPNGFSTTFLSTPGDHLAEIVQEELKPLGIDVAVRRVDVNQVFTVQGKGDYEITDEYWTEDIPDPDERTGWFLDEKSSRDYFTSHHEPALRRLVRQSEKVFDQDERGRLYAEIQRMQAQSLPQIPLYYSPYAYAFSDKVHGFEVSPLGNYHMEDVWLG
jgi:peptide/nickel transport system substrate-binding protein